MEEKSYKEYLEHITTFIFDVDGVLTDGFVNVTSDGELLRKMHVRDGYALKYAINAGYNIAIISAGTNEGVKIRLEGLGIPHVYLGSTNKVDTFKQYIKETNIKPENILYMGDDIPDRQVMTMVGLPTCPQDAVPEIKSVSKYISHRKGGEGAVRDVLEQVLKVQNNWMV
ncbi:KdsC family phosphatase [Siansivirga zeaxanthinifaciens]|uniref:3-deoxy-D-manno-octulosonate 8-phosphate phosphatase n=1 Tax=Siansivirga zeaxanthinifaciens CC-SAMT-1 TaxID=1454006 RepID=A0A0C5WM37_9FLAO|nr:HAD-IIIA family hydrolase [Siansivirga zeaxanthinifaciens]AJR03910.1 3-deoxy-D-manno-octulosonate 8-phosphate phosphatase [Siansivirga zeaxanthinifaciens CC-SAMT-1]